ncbi:alanine/glycine:cation symporter family protein [Marinobacter sp. F4206]|uniref:alanine/glycine:cation symporter family protein n=1 Tax=Marinobacter sp. F4206 TaxID=2861777 RepID=UPI001C5CE69A|nr:sodium:alanine symporter family protein [Marinobacter sp. F4206]MBW4935155.1 sodium:alanine symporter family protein [Marinobacter sp. F4206]
MQGLVEGVGEVIWGPLTIVLLVGTGLFLSVRLRFIQLLRLGLSLRIVSGRDAESSRTGELSHFSALTVALSAAIGNGNIAGVATAIALGGPGAIFWMWVTAIVGMATVFASTTLALRFRVFDPETGYAGGPMYYIERGLGPKWKPLAQFFALCAIIAAFGTGNMVEANSVADTLEFSLRDILAYEPLERTVFGVKLGIGILYGALIWLVIVGGIRRIGRVVSRLVPLMFVIYVGSALVVLGLNADAVPAALVRIVSDAFTGTAATGGFAGAAVMTTIQFGVARGVFSNEAGLGTTPIAMAAARSDEPVRAGLVAMNGPLFDTLVVCTITALVIITTGVWTTGVSGSELTTMAFNAAVPDLGKLAVTLSLLFFSFSSVVGWSYYGDRGTGYLFGNRQIKHYRKLFCLLLPLGAVMDLELIWGLCDIANGLMAVPNLIALLLLSPLVVRLTRDYFERRAAKAVP